ncbi:MAG: type I restriction enzyme HsdR N-terminal domain-containing protein [Planctomycetes bacterium]|nr:type I restriction enzyme HsdR N-terminal domain-containing protein [Planctomycetota bacterium]
MSVPKRVADRMRNCLKHYVEILVTQRDRDVSEADTVTIVKDLLSDVFGYDKYLDLTSEHAVRGTYCDLAIRIESKLKLLVEVKAIGINLTERHTKQAVDYAANQGLEWVALTNGIRWTLYHVVFKKPIEQNVVVDLDLLTLDPFNDAELEKLYLLSKEGVLKDAVTEYRERKDATSRFIVAAILLNSDDVLNVVRREIRRVSDVLVDREVIAQVLREEVIKREAIEGDRAAEAQRRVLRATDRPLRADSDEKDAVAPAADVPPVPDPRPAT